MNRQELREYIRFLINEYTERPEGFIKDETTGEIDLNLLINISQVRVQIDLLPDIPHFFVKPVLLNISANKNVYDVETDWSITNFILFEDIFHNQSGKKPDGLLYAERDQIQEFDIKVGGTGEPKIWTYEGRKSVGFYPIPASTVNERYKGYYFYELPDLNQDTDHNPSESKYAIPDIPKAAHPLIGLDVVEQIQTADESGALEIKKIKEFEKNKALKLLGIKPSFRTEVRESLAESIR